MQRWAFANDIPFALLLTTCVFVIGACILTIFFAATP